MYDVIIIGAGPAGLTAALYAGRYRLRTGLFEKMSPGGQILMSATIENYPGLPGQVATVDLVDKLRQQVEEVGVTIENEEAASVRVERERGGALFVVQTPEKEYRSKSVILAVGSLPKQLGVDGEEKLTGRGVS
jgi:thioredoxin reductase (NADPH)